MEDNKIVELFFTRQEEAIRQTHDAYGRRPMLLAALIALQPSGGGEGIGCGTNRLPAVPGRNRGVRAIIRRNLPWKKSFLRNCPWMEHRWSTSASAAEAVI